MLRLLLIAALTIAPGLAIGQSTPTPDASTARCLLAGKAFSPGATVRASASVNVCGPDGNWAISQLTASGCFFADNFYSVGASAAVPGSKTAVELCGPDGIWTTTATP
jgi:hypothetical protein